MWWKSQREYESDYASRCSSWHRPVDYRRNYRPRYRTYETIKLEPLLSREIRFDRAPTPSEREKEVKQSPEVSDKSDHSRNRKKKSRGKRSSKDDHVPAALEKEISVSPISEASPPPTPPRELQQPSELQPPIELQPPSELQPPIELQPPSELQQTEPMEGVQKNHFLSEDSELSPGVADVLDGHDKVNNAIVDMIIRDDVPWKVMESGGFNFILKTFVPSYVMPSRASISEIIDHKYLIISSLMKEKLTSVDSVTISTEFWEGKVSGNNTVVVSAHYVSDNKPQSIVIGMIKADGGSSADSVKDSLSSICGEWGITVDRITALVTTSHAVLHNAALQLVGKARVLICFAEQLNRVAQRLFEDDDVKQLLASVRSIVAFFKENSAAHNELKENHGVSLVGLLHSKISWFSNFILMDKYVRHAEAIEVVLKKYPNSPQVLEAQNLSSLKELVNITNSLYLSSCELQKDEYMQCGKIIPLVSCLRSAGLMLKPATLLGKLLAQKLMIEIAVKFRRVELVHMLAHSTLLDPKYKEKYFQDKVACLEAKIRINQMLGDEEASGTMGVGSGEGGRIWDFHDVLGNGVGAIPQVGSKWNELHAFLCGPISPEGTDAIDYWTQYSKMYPKLSKIALKCLPVTGVAVTCKRLITSTGMEAKDCEELLKILLLKSVPFPIV